MASRYYCGSVAAELEGWSARLHNLSDEIERIPSIDKYRMLPQIEQLHILMTELDDRLCDLVNSCATADTGIETLTGEKVVEDWNVGKGVTEKFDYEVGG